MVRCCGHIAHRGGDFCGGDKGGNRTKDLRAKTRFPTPSPVQMVNSKEHRIFLYVPLDVASLCMNIIIGGERDFMPIFFFYAWVSNAFELPQNREQTSNMLKEASFVKSV